MCLRFNFFPLFLDLQLEARVESQEGEILLQTPPKQAEVIKLKNLWFLYVEQFIAQLF